MACLHDATARDSVGELVAANDTDAISAAFGRLPGIATKARRDTAIGASLVKASRTVGTMGKGAPQGATAPEFRSSETRESASWRRLIGTKGRKPKSLPPDTSWPRMPGCGTRSGGPGRCGDGRRSERSSWTSAGPALSLRRPLLAASATMRHLLRDGRLAGTGRASRTRLQPSLIMSERRGNHLDERRSVPTLALVTPPSSCSAPVRGPCSSPSRNADPCP